MMKKYSSKKAENQWVGAFSHSLPFIKASLLFLVALPCAHANDLHENLSDALANGKVNLDARYRYEFVDQDSKREASASTIRTRVGFETGELYGVYAKIEGENISYIGGERFNNTLNGKTSFATVEDPDTTEINQLLLGINSLPDTQIKFGRQVLAMGSGHFIGSQDWRQNQTTYDALSVSNESIKDTIISYSYIANQHNYLGDDSVNGEIDLRTHALDVTYQGFAFSDITPYAYFIEDKDTPANSNRMVGVFLAGENKINDDFTFTHNAEYAVQSDYENNPNNVDLAYYHIEPGIKWKTLTLTLGYESLEGDGTTGFITILGDNHNFNGWVDKFNTIPADGLEDRFITLSYKVKGLHDYVDGTKLFAGYHQFDSENTNVELGDEWNFKISKTFAEHYTPSIYYEAYNKDTFSKDTQKIIGQIEVKF